MIKKCLGLKGIFFCRIFSEKVKHATKKRTKLTILTYCRNPIQSIPGQLSPALHYAQNSKHITENFLFLISCDVLVYVSLCVCAITENPLPGGLETSGRRAYP